MPSLGLPCHSRGEKSALPHTMVIQLDVHSAHIARSKIIFFLAGGNKNSCIDLYHIQFAIIRINFIHQPDSKQSPIHFKLQYRLSEHPLSSPWCEKDLTIFLKKLCCSQNIKMRFYQHHNFILRANNL